MPIKKLLENTKKAFVSVLSADRDVYCAYLTLIVILSYIISVLELRDMEDNIAQ